MLFVLCYRNVEFQMDNNQFFLLNHGNVGSTVQSPQPSVSGNVVSSVPSDQSSVGGPEFPFPPTLPHTSENSSAISGAPEESEKLATEKPSLTFQHAWEMQDRGNGNGNGEQELRVYSQKDTELKDSRRAIIAHYVAGTKEILHLNNVSKFLGEEKAFSEVDGFTPKNMLCVPIFNGQRDLIGVAQLVNKRQSQEFTEQEIALFEAFAIFCGIGIHNTKLYEGACRLMAKQKVALDCLSYHASAADGDTEALMKAEIGNAESFNLYR